MDQTWMEEWPGRKDCEISDLLAHGAEVEVHEGELKEGRLQLKVFWLFEGKRVRFDAVYPADFPHFPPEVYAINGKFDRHQHPRGRNLCLLGRGALNWVPSMTLAKLLKSQFPKIVAANRNPDNPEVRRLEEVQGIPAEMYWNEEAVNESYILVDSSWVMGGEHKYGTIEVHCSCRVIKGEPKLQGVISKVADENGQLLYEWVGNSETHC